MRVVVSSIFISSSPPLVFARLLDPERAGAHHGDQVGKVSMIRMIKMSGDPPSKADAPAFPGKVPKALMRAAGHPVRVQAFSIVAERVASPTEIADQLGLQDVSQVNYHLGVLKDLNLVELVRTKKRRGATEHFYRSVQRPLVSEEEWRQFSGQERENFTTLALQLILLDIARALNAGIFDERDDRHLTRTPFEVDEEGWEELVQVHLEAFYRSLEIQARSDERRRTSGETAFAVYSVQMLFEGRGDYRK
jgi:DNA-binding transcriptional ArsR family regulator